MLGIPLLITLIASICFLLLFFLNGAAFDCIYQLYKDNFRNLLFSGFLTLGSFLFSIKAFILIRLKEGIYDQEWYQDEHVADVMFLDANLDDYTIQLKNLSSLLYYSVLFAFISAFVHISIGLLHYSLVSMICILFSVFSFSIVLYALVQIKNSFATWMIALDKTYSGKLKSKKEQMEAKIFKESGMMPQDGRE